MFTSEPPPPRRTAARVAMAAEVRRLIEEDGLMYRDIAMRLKLSGTSVVSRLYHESVTTSMTDEIRAQELARLEAWGQRMEEAFEMVLATKPEAAGALGMAAAKLSSEIRRVMGVDKPVQLNVKHGKEEGFTPDPWAGRAAEAWKQSELYKEGLREAGRNGDEDAG